MSLALKEQGYVVMPSRPPQTPVSVVIQSLLLCFRSLSRAKALKITIPYSESAEQLLNACSKALHEGLETPTIDYKKTYSGREWVRDDWTAYNINDYDETTLPVAWNPLVSDPPPAYVEHDGTAAIGNPTKAHLKHPDFSHQPRQMSPSIPDTESPSFSPPPVTPAASHTLGKRKRSHEDGSAESPSPSLPEDRRKIRYSHPPRQTSSSLADTLLPSSICSLPATLPLSSLLGELPAQDRSSPLPAEEGLPILPHRRFRISKRSAVGAGPNSALFDTGQWHLFNNALTWLTTAWDVLPAAHAVFLPELRTLAHAIRECDKATFNQTRVKCMVDLVRRERAAPCRGEGLWEREGGHGERVEEVTRWLYQHVGAEADTAVVHELLALDDMVRFLEMAERGEDRREEELCRRGLVIQMGTCIMVALFKTD
ncbi:Uridylate kinase [Lasiodiplodia theobromae]|uniref:Uridylate kinase n=1 Tax=Lasiodiplodia theobromae TaxID=45133 RepID=UPI0015C3381B|nr:Uridylate kinase [Lasiodiplodia theobromae]KAF4534649.1 Uridylate kinase [Lasiodiplodia theobromae]